MIKSISRKLKKQDPCEKLTKENIANLAFMPDQKFRKYKKKCLEKLDKKTKNRDESEIILQTILGLVNEDIPMEEVFPDSSTKD